MTTLLVGDGRLIVGADEVGWRLDVLVAARLPTLSRARVQRLIRAGLVTGDGRKLKASAAVSEGMIVVVTVPPPTPAVPQSEPLPLSILYDDPDVVVINKPAGMVVHPGAGHAGGTLVNALLHHVPDLSGIGGQQRPGIVHRLDRGTSGAMVIAKTDDAHRALSRQFHDRLVTKEYVVLVWGAVQAGETIDRPIGRHPQQRLKMSSRARSARAAVTTVLGVEPFVGVSLARVRIHTGRTHQIRVHLSEAGHPVVGDALYGGVRRQVPRRLVAVERLDRPFLHAARLAFVHPTDGRLLSFDADLPDDLTDALAALRRATKARTTT